MHVLEGSSPEDIDPDVAIRGLENMASSLQKLSDDDQRRLRSAFNAIAAKEDEPYRRFIQGIPDLMGLRNGPNG